MAINGTVKHMNSEYAPGISSYGIDGKSGKDGGDGTSVFICIFDIKTSDGVEKFVDYLLHSYDMTNSLENKIKRDYISGDNFIFPDGTIWRVDDIDDLKNAIAVGQVTTTAKLQEYITQVGAIQGNTDDGFTTSNSNMYLDNANYKGFVIDTTGTAGQYALNSPLSIISNESGNDNITRFISMLNIFAGQSATKFDIYFDNNAGAWVLDADKPILLNSDLKVTYSNGLSTDYDEYSKPLLSENSITKFYGNCQDVKVYYGNIIPEIKDVEFDDGSVTEYITPKKKISEFALQYPDEIQFDSNNLLLDAYKKIYIRLGVQNASGRYVFQRILTESEHYFTVKLLFNNVVMKSAYIREKVNSNQNYLSLTGTGLLEINLEEMTKDIDIDDNYKLVIIWSLPIANTNETVDVSIQIPFVENKNIVSNINFKLDGDVAFLQGCWFHITRWEDQLITGEYHVPIDQKLVTTKEFPITIQSSVPLNTKWQVSAVKSVEVDLTTEFKPED